MLTDLKKLFLQIYFRVRIFIKIQLFKNIATESHYINDFQVAIFKITLLLISRQNKDYKCLYISCSNCFIKCTFLFLLTEIEFPFLRVIFKPSTLRMYSKLTI